MTDIETAGVENGEGVAAPSIRILAQFIRDLSFENPRAPESLRPTGVQPQIDIGVELNARAREDNLYEVDLKFTAGARHEADMVFQIELLYGGLFQIQGVPEESMEPVLLIECPRFMFPFVRKVVADLTTEGGFPPFMLDPIDFGAIYAARRGQLSGEPAGQA
ncbi:MAG: protein-export chaperone SecB [Caulobacteraceae bacterium]|nr:protein-export chaperone SecB [Caulobacteraceae bacterium]